MTPRSSKLALVLCPDVHAWERPVFESLAQAIATQHPVETFECDGDITAVVAAIRKSGATAVWAVTRRWRAMGRRLVALLPSSIRVSVSALGIQPHSPSLPALFWENIRPVRTPRFRVLTHSHFAHRFLGEMERVPAARLVHLPLPVPDLAAKPKPSGFPAAPVTVGVLGAFSTDTNLHFALNVAHYLVARRPDIRFRLVGGGNLKAHLTSSVFELGLSRTVELVEPRGKWDGLGLDLMIYAPLRNEHHVPMLVAASEAVPVICSEIVGIEEFIQDGHDAFILPINETKPMGELALRLIDDSALRRFFGGRLRERLSRQCFLGAIAESYSSHFFSDQQKTAVSQAA
jgi:glycosyltransferase involved in cell wall biosynthesis